MRNLHQTGAWAVGTAGQHPPPPSPPDQETGKIRDAKIKEKLTVVEPEEPRLFCGARNIFFLQPVPFYEIFTTFQKDGLLYNYYRTLLC